ncbi:hypothetical protein LINGRAPRIM_LOCUS777 [Linum grandiflorum]
MPKRKVGNHRRSLSVQHTSFEILAALPELNHHRNKPMLYSGQSCWSKVQSM